MALARRTLATVLQSFGLTPANFPGALLERDENEWVAVLDAVDAALRQHGVSLEDLLAYPQRGADDAQPG
jgi:hypothetical protein